MLSHADARILRGNGPNIKHHIQECTTFKEKQYNSSKQKKDTYNFTAFVVAGFFSSTPDVFLYEDTWVQWLWAVHTVTCCSGEKCLDRIAEHNSAAFSFLLESIFPLALHVLCFKGCGVEVCCPRITGSDWDGKSIILGFNITKFICSELKLHSPVKVQIPYLKSQMCQSFVKFFSKVGEKLKIRLVINDQI